MATATKDLPIGFELPTKTAKIERFRHARNSEKGDWPSEKWQGSIHEAKYAQSLGLKGGVAEGEITAELGLLEQLTTFFGESFLTTGVWDFKLPSPVYVGDTLTGGGKLREKVTDGGRVRLVFDVVVEKQDGKLALVGTASAIVT